MIRTIRLLTGAAALSAALSLAPGLAGARPHSSGGGMGSHDGLHLERSLESLGLEAEVRSSALAVVDAGRERARELRYQLQQAHDSLRALLALDDPDAAAVSAQLEAIGALETELRKHEIGVLLDVRALLTPEQEQKLMQRLGGKGGRRARR